MKRFVTSKWHHVAIALFVIIFTLIIAIQLQNEKAQPSISIESDETTMFQNNHDVTTSTQKDEPAENEDNKARQNYVDGISYIESRQLIEAIRALQEVPNTAICSDEAKKALQDAKNAYRETVVQSAIETNREWSAQAAAAVIYDGLSVLNSDAELQELYDLFMSDSGESKYFLQLTGTKGNEFNGTNKFFYIDSYGEEQSKPYLVTFVYGPSKNTRNTYRKYTKLTGRFCFCDTLDEQRAKLIIYKDDVPVFDSGVRNKRDGNLDFSVDISDAYTVSVELVNIENAKCFISDAQVFTGISDSKIAGVLAHYNYS